MDTLLELAQVTIVEEWVKRLEMDKPTCLVTFMQNGVGVLVAAARLCEEALLCARTL